jgi:enoyl-CoA hydratase/carnithine racemase
MPFVQEYAQDLAANCSPTSMSIMKRQIYQHLTESLGDAHADSVRLMLDTFNRPDFKEGVQSFLEKRAPKFPRV